MKIIGVIPARYASTPFPGKPLHKIAGKPLVQHVIEQCQKAGSLAKVIVATDDTQIWELAQRFCDVEMTRSDHPSGTIESRKWRKDTRAMRSSIFRVMSR